MGDYHVHLNNHGPRPDGQAPGYAPDQIERYVEVAAGRGVTEIGFTEHLYRCVESTEVLGPFWEFESRDDLAEQAESFVTEDRWLSLDAYVAAVIVAKDRGLPVLLGLEVDFFPETIDAVVELLAPYPWDLLIGSVHWIGGWGVDNVDVAFEFERRGVDRAWAEFLELELALAASGAVDVLAHVDVVKKQGYRPRNEPIDAYAAVAATAAGSGTSVELNSNGLNAPAGEIYPSSAFLGEFFKAGVGITFGSDAHSPDHAARGFAASAELAKSVGYDKRIRFASRSGSEVPM